MSSSSSPSSSEKSSRPSISRYDDIEFVRSNNPDEWEDINDKGLEKLDSYRKSIVKVDFIDPSEKEMDEKKKSENSKSTTNDSSNLSDDTGVSDEDEEEKEKKTDKEDRKKVDRLIPGLQRSIDRFGKPTVLYIDQKSSDSFATWLKKDLRREKFKGFENITRSGHFEDGKNVSVTIHFHLPSDKICNILQIDRSIFYDQNASLLTCRHESWSSCCAILYLTCRCTTGHISVDDIKKKKIVRKMLRNAQKSDRYVTKLQEMLLSNGHKK